MDIQTWDHTRLEHTRSIWDFKDPFEWFLNRPVFNEGDDCPRRFIIKGAGWSSRDEYHDAKVKGVDHETYFRMLDEFGDNRGFGQLGDHDDNEICLAVYDDKGQKAEVAHRCLVADVLTFLRSSTRFRAFVEALQGPQLWQDREKLQQAVEEYGGSHYRAKRAADIVIPQLRELAEAFLDDEDDILLVEELVEFINVEREVHNNSNDDVDELESESEDDDEAEGEDNDKLKAVEKVCHSSQMLNDF